MNSLSAMCKHCIGCSLSFMSRATSYIEVYFPRLQKMLKISPFGSDTFSTLPEKFWFTRCNGSLDVRQNSSDVFPCSVYILLQSIISWTVVLSHHIKRYSHSHTLTHIHIHLQNNRRWPLCKSVNVGIVAGNTAERYLQEGPVRLPLWQ
jgi:hypothetical protein